ncbi:MAG TPA: folate-binding protein [Caulobacteraceae bacterium]|jgi:hypothetical protein
MPLLHAPLPSRALLEVKGPDWRPFLQGLLTQDVLTLAPGELRFAALLTPQGKFLFDLFLTGRDDGCLLDVQAARRDELRQRLLMYRLRAKVEIASVPGAVSVLWPSSPALPGEGWMPDPRLPLLGWRTLDGSRPTEAEPAGEDAYHAHRLSLGVPDPARDCLPDKTYPIEANFDLLHGIDFKKGCFVGQETASRMKRRGQIKTRMLPIRFDGPPPPFGAEVLAGELRAGEVLSGRDGAAIALLRLDRIEGAELTAEGRPLRAWRPEWLEA